MMNRRYRRRWIVAFWGLNGVGAMLFVVCAAADVSWWWILTAWWIAWFTGFWAAVLVEIATQ